jgi:hypothetical protein
MAQRLPQVTRAHQKRLAIDLFNGAWNLILKRHRSPEDDEKMINMAHASLFHWGVVGRARNVAVGEWQVSHVYSLAGRTAEALHHAERCLEVCRRAKLKDWSLAYAYEALARAHAVGGNRQEYRDCLRLAERAGAAIAEREDREQFAKDLDDLVKGSGPRRRQR